MRVKIVIPIYKKELSREEKRSLKQCLTLLNRHEFVFVTYEGLDVHQYISIVNDTNANTRFEYFDQDYFESIQSYNRLLLNRSFYLRFRQEDFILIYQLDAFVFKDELAYWCEKDFDYIGSPWFTRYGSYENGDVLYKVGNGGASLRKIPSFLERFEKRPTLSIFPFYVKNIRKKRFFSMSMKTIKIFFLLMFSKKQWSTIYQT